MEHVRSNATKGWRSRGGIRPRGAHRAALLCGAVALSGTLAFGCYGLAVFSRLGFDGPFEGDEAVRYAQFLLFAAGTALAVLALVPAILNRWWLWMLPSSLAGFCVAVAVAIAPYDDGSGGLTEVIPFVGSVALLVAAVVEWLGRARTAFVLVSVSVLTIPLFFVVKSAFESAAW